MLLRGLLIKLPSQLNGHRRGFSKDLANVGYMLDRLQRHRPFAVPRVFLSPLPEYRRLLDDHVYDIFHEVSLVMQPDRMLRELENLSRLTTWGFEDAPLKIKRKPAEGQKEGELANGEASGDDNKYAVKVRAAEFKPEEIVVKVRDGYVTVEAQKEEKDVENGTYKYHQIRKSFQLPRNVDEDSVSCEMTKDGYLTIQADINQSRQLEDKTRGIPIKKAENQPEMDTQAKEKDESAKE